MAVFAEEMKFCKGKNMLRNTAISVICLLIFAPACIGEGEVRELRQYEYWDSGKIKGCVFYDIEGRLKAKAYCRNDGTVEKIEKYDTGGNKISAAFYNGKGKLKTGVDGWAAMRWWYDGSQIVSQISYDEEGVPMDRRQYSESGRLILRQYRDSANFDPYEGAAMSLLLGNRNIPYYDTARRADR